MSLIIQKFGGTSLADPRAREALAAKAVASKRAGDSIVLVVSAMGRRGDAYATDTLIDMLAEYTPTPDPLTSDLMVSCGEVISACLIAALLKSRGLEAVPLTAHSVPILAKGPYGDADPLDIDPSGMASLLAAGAVPVVTGFQGSDENGRILTLGRGGSDTTAVALGAALGAAFVDIYKDVPGVAKADPRLVPEAEFMDFLDYDSMFRLANHGARVLHDKSALLAREKGIRMRVRSTFDEGEGTLIAERKAGLEPPRFLGVSTGPMGPDTMRVTAVFATGSGALLAAKALSAVETSGIPAERREVQDPDATSFLCRKDRAGELARLLYGALN